MEDQIKNIIFKFANDVTTISLSFGVTFLEKEKKCTEKYNELLEKINITLK